MAFGAAEAANLTTFSRSLPGSGGGRSRILAARAGPFVRKLYAGGTIRAVTRTTQIEARPAATHITRSCGAPLGMAAPRTDHRPANRDRFHGNCPPITGIVETNAIFARHIGRPTQKYNIYANAKSQERFRNVPNTARV